MKLRPYQSEAIDFFIDHTGGRAIYADAPGTGKTPTTCRWLAENDCATSVLIVAPLPVLEHWSDELERWAPEYRVFVGNGTPGYRAETRAAFRDYDERKVLILNYETLRADVGRLTPLRFDAFVADEAHRLKNRKSQTFKAAAKVARRTDEVLLVTGTPILNSAEELWSLLHLLQPKEYPSFWRWAEEYCDIEVASFYGRPPVTLVNGMKPGAADALRAQLADVLIQRPIEQLLPDMPDVEHVMLPVYLSAGERKLYRQLEAHYWTQQEGSVVIAPNEVSKLTRLRQLASDWGGLWEENTPGTKVKAAVELVDDLAPEQVVVLTAYKETARRIAELVGAPAYTGDTSAEERESMLRRFRAGEETVLVGTLATVGEGVDGLQVARHVVLVDRDWTPARNEQAIARIRRSGQQADQVVAYHIFARDTVDETVARMLVEKQGVIDALLGPER